jgi:hypothetical protein
MVGTLAITLAILDGLVSQQIEVASVPSRKRLTGKAKIIHWVSRR